MRRLTKNLVIILVLLLAPLFDPISTVIGQDQQILPQPPQTPQPPKTSRVIVRYRSITPEIVRNIIDRQTGSTRLTSLLQRDTVVVQVPQGLEQSIASLYAANIFVDFAEPDAVAEASIVPNDSQLNRQWSLSKISAPAAWDTADGIGSTIAILDTGIASTHPDVTSKVDKWANFTSSRTLYDRNNHGTHVAGIAAATPNNDIGIVGVGYNTRLFSAKVLSDNGRGFYSWIINGIHWATDNGADVINLSLGGPSNSQALKQAIDYAWQRGVVVVAAAGNANSSLPHYPAWYQNSLAVAATDTNDNKASFSNFGNWVDISAPGSDILSTVPQSDYATLSGTSMAAPQVAGLAALLKSLNNPDNQQIRTAIESSADKISQTQIFWQFGRINASNAVDYTRLHNPNLPTSTPALPSSTPTTSPSPSPSPPPSLQPTPSPLPSPTLIPEVPQGPSRPIPVWCYLIPNHRRCQV